MNCDRWDYSFEYRDLELISTALIQWRELVISSACDERLTEGTRESKRKFAEELTEIIDEIRTVMNRRRY